MRKVKAITSYCLIERGPAAHAEALTQNQGGEPVARRPKSISKPHSPDDLLLGIIMMTVDMSVVDGEYGGRLSSVEVVEYIEDRLSIELILEEGRYDGSTNEADIGYE